MRNIPGFSAEVSANTTRKRYALRAVWANGVRGQKIVEQGIPSGIDFVKVDSYYDRHVQCVSEFVVQFDPLNPDSPTFCRSCCYIGSFLLYCEPRWYRCYR